MFGFVFAFGFAFVAVTAVAFAFTAVAAFGFVFACVFAFALGERVAAAELEAEAEAVATSFPAFTILVEIPKILCHTDTKKFQIIRKNPTIKPNSIEKGHTIISMIFWINVRGGGAHFGASFAGPL